jgi:hypothetical protein
MIERVQFGIGLGDGGVFSPVSFVKGEGLVTGVRVQDRVPDGVKVASTADVGGPLIVATPVALGEL